MDDKIAYARPQNVSSGDEAYTFPAGSTVEVVCAADMALQQIGYVWDNEKKLLTLTKDGIGATQGDYGLALVNTTDAAAGAQQYSPPIRWRGEGWKSDATAASQTVDFRAFVRPIQGATAAKGSLDFQVSINGGAYSNLMSLFSSGRVGIGTTVEGDHLEIAGTLHMNINAASYLKMTRTDEVLRLGTQSSEATLQLMNAHHFRIVNASNVDLVRFEQGGNVGIGTENPGQILDCNDGSGNMIADGYDSHPASENIAAIDVAGMVDKLKSFGLITHTRTPFVSADELRTATIKHFSQGRWIKAFGGEIVEGKNGVKRIEGDNSRGGKLRTCPDEAMLAFLDSTADGLREERRPLPEWTRKHIAPNLHDPTAVEAMGDIVGYDDEGKITGYSLNNYVGFLHGVILELVDRVEVLEAA